MDRCGDEAATLRTWRTSSATRPQGRRPHRLDFRPRPTVAAEAAGEVLTGAVVTFRGPAVGGVHADASFRKAGLAEAIDEVLQRRSVAEWLRRGPVVGREVRVADEEQLDLCTHLVEPAQLGKDCRQETA